MKLHKSIVVQALFFFIVLSWGCSKDNQIDDNSRQETFIQGAVEKGPFVRGSVVTIEELNADLSQTGRSFSSEILDDKGSFTLEGVALVSDYIRLSVNGYYFDELNGSLSSSQIKLNAIADVSNSKDIHINVLSHLEEKRVRHLIKEEKKSFNEAKQQALGEIYKAFFVKTNPTSNSESISLTKNNDDANILLGISATLLSITKSNNAVLTEVLSRLSSDIEGDGHLDEEWATVIELGLKSLNPQNLSENVKNRYAGLGINIPDFTLDKVFSVEMEGLPEPVDHVVDDYFHTEQAFALAYDVLVQRSMHTIEQYFKLEGLYSKTISELPQDMFYLHDVRPNNSALDNLFTAIYRNLIRPAVTIIDQGGQSANPAIKSYQYKSYPYFAYGYWVLMNFWGDPVYIDSENYSTLEIMARTRKEEVSAKLLDGLDEAIANLTAFDKEADVARAIATRIAVDNGDYTKAKKYVDPIINGRRYALSPNDQIHISPAETIFGFVHSANTKPVHYNLYGKGDYRHIMRYTEIILLAVEINLKLKADNDAITLLNLVRERNGKTALASNESNILYFLQEEMKEDLKNEGVYFAFLKRHDLAESALGIQSYQKLLPIPMRELAINRYVTQNDRY